MEPISVWHRGGSALIADGSAALGLAEPALSNLDGLDATPALPPGGTIIYYSVDPATTAALAPYAAFSADIFAILAAPGYSFPLGAPPAAVFVAATGIGLAPGDDIDGLHYMDDGDGLPSSGDLIYFSLTPTSPSLPGLFAGPADILLTSPGGTPGLFIPAATLGLAATDNVDALHMHIPGAGLPVQLKNFNVE